MSNWVRIALWRGWAAACNADQDDPDKSRQQASQEHRKIGPAALPNDEKAIKQGTRTRKQQNGACHDHEGGRAAAARRHVVGRASGRALPFFQGDFVCIAHDSWTIHGRYGCNTGFAFEAARYEIASMPMA